MAHKYTSAQPQPQPNESPVTMPYLLEGRGPGLGPSVQRREESHLSKEPGWGLPASPFETQNWWDAQAEPVAAKAVSVPPVLGRQTILQRLCCRSCEQKEEDSGKPPSLGRQINLMRNAEVGAAGGDVSGDVEQRIQRSRGQGQEIAAPMREKYEQAFGRDFGGVRIHADRSADQLNRAVQAKAFTTGNDIYFKQGEYRPESRGGQELLAHELTHVVQQRSDVSGGKIPIQLVGHESSQNILAHLPHEQIQTKCEACESEEKIQPSLANAFQPRQTLEDQQVIQRGLWSDILDVTQVGLDVAGLVPGFGIIPDLANAGISAARGDAVGAGLSLAAAVPGAGLFAGAGKLGIKGTKLAKGAKTAGGVAETATKESLERAAKKKIAKEAAEKAAKEKAEKRQKKIAECQMIHAAYKSLGPCRKCKGSDTPEERAAKIRCITGELAARRRYLKKKCDYVLPGSITRGSAVAEAGHRKQVQQLTKMLLKCQTLPTVQP